MKVLRLTDDRHCRHPADSLQSSQTPLRKPVTTLFIPQAECLIIGECLLHVNVKGLLNYERVGINRNNYERDLQTVGTLNWLFQLSSEALQLHLVNLK